MRPETLSNRDIPIPAPTSWRRRLTRQLRVTIEVAKGFAFDVRGTYTAPQPAGRDEPPSDADIDYQQVRFNGVVVAGNDAEGRWHDWYEFFSHDLLDRLEAAVLAHVERVEQ